MTPKSPYNTVQSLLSIHMSSDCSKGRQQITIQHKQTKILQRNLKKRQTNYKTCKIKNIQQMGKIRNVLSWSTLSVWQRWRNVPHRTSAELERDRADGYYWHRPHPTCPTKRSATLVWPVRGRQSNGPPWNPAKDSPLTHTPTTKWGTQNLPNLLSAKQIQTTATTVTALRTSKCMPTLPTES